MCISELLLAVSYRRSIRLSSCFGCLCMFVCFLFFLKMHEFFARSSNMLSSYEYQLFYNIYEKEIIVFL
ncbi:hypothetical protein KFK09_004110 [Dendrobium nobile]|uniref:Uncharacterized protein n=1 Tax=Dendrobium nobile TaxID=94219 RepID=A0A8T3C4W5_DENNO|nr:hypothetical protein KFK09_004110 [Dendrobium nobile]